MKCYVLHGIYFRDAETIWYREIFSFLGFVFVYAWRWQLGTIGNSNIPLSVGDAFCVGCENAVEPWGISFLLDIFVSFSGPWNLWIVGIASKLLVECVKVWSFTRNEISLLLFVFLLSFSCKCCLIINNKIFCWEQQRLFISAKFLEIRR